MRSRMLACACDALFSFSTCFSLTLSRRTVSTLSNAALRSATLFSRSAMRRFASSAVRAFDSARRFSRSACERCSLKVFSFSRASHLNPSAFAASSFARSSDFSAFAWRDSSRHCFSAPRAASRALAASSRRFSASASCFSASLRSASAFSSRSRCSLSAFSLFARSWARSRYSLMRCPTFDASDWAWFCIDDASIWASRTFSAAFDVLS